MKTRFFPHSTSEYTYVLAEKVNKWHEQHEKFHNNADQWIPKLHDCIVFIAASEKFFAITHHCDFSDIE